MDIRKHKIVLLLALGPLSLTQAPHRHGVGDFCKFVKCTMIPGVKSELDSHASTFGASDKSDSLQDNGLRQYHSLVVPFTSSHAVNLH